MHPKLFPHYCENSKKDAHSTACPLFSPWWTSHDVPWLVVQRAFLVNSITYNLATTGLSAVVSADDDCKLIRFILVHLFCNSISLSAVFPFHSLLPIPQCQYHRMHCLHRTFLFSCIGSIPAPSFPVRVLMTQSDCHWHSTHTMGYLNVQYRVIPFRFHSTTTLYSESLGSVSQQIPSTCNPLWAWWVWVHISGIPGPPLIVNERSFL